MYIQSLHPNLVEESSFLTVFESKAGRLVLKVLDLEGRIAKTVVTLTEEGNQQINVNMSDLSTGAYVLNAFFKDRFIQSIRFIKQ